jgi:two-component system, cell cycle response regulator DivK
MAEAQGSILVVEDNEQNLELVLYLLEEAALPVVVARTADEARAEWKKSLPRLVLLDMHLPGIDGMSLVRELREDPRTQALPVVAVTAHAMRGDRERFLAGGCTGYIAKPIQPGTFVDEVRAYLSGGRQEGGRA